MLGLPDTAIIIDVQREMSRPDVVAFLIESPELPRSNWGEVVQTVNPVFEDRKVSVFQSWGL